MEDNFYKDDFEQFLKEQADSHRMYPSDAIWRNINKQLHGEKSWPALTIAAFVLLITTIAVCIHFTPQPNIFALHPNVSIAQSTATSAEENALATVTPIALQKDDISQKASSWRNAQQPVSNINTANVFTDRELVVHNQPATSSSVSERTMATSKESSVAPSRLLLSEVASPKLIATKQISLQEDNNEQVQNVLTSTPEISKALPANLPKLKVDQKDLSKEIVGMPLTPSPVKQSWKKRFSYQVNVTPSVSYRRLRENKKTEKESEGPVALNLVADVHQIVRHKPGNGLEAGMALFYSLNKRLRIKTGFQFNVRQYKIEAYKSQAELATITLHRNYGIDTINSFAFYRTSSGYQDAEINNRYYQVAIPVGIDYEVLGNKIVQLNIGASIQPTYQVNTEAFILSTNLKNYTQTSDILQHWNINSSFEAYLSFKAGKYKWQVGPQVRYQHLPSMVPQYPIREHLLDYGLKIGVTKPL
ncbi:hypothetical protein [Aridibaculum aurantiacum]|uniref:hypothetical protein n=1 Tax=Aridibaculum aurantiacum TaxID=2810307 RepID=UPI001A95F24C|nr:hypothetical protein [Aridibaculum aurantiacum]